MLAGARRRLAQAGAGPVAVVAAAAEALPFAGGAADVVVSRFGVMLFADPAAGVREMARVVRTGGTVAAAVWGAPERNPYLDVPIGVLERVAGVPRATPEVPGVFRLAAPGALAAHFTAAGLADVHEDRRAFTMEAPLGLDVFWDFLLRLAAPTRAAVQSLPPAVQAEIAAAIRREVAPSEMVVVQGRRVA
jgi:SAM-dependent methyltransferase